MMCLKIAILLAVFAVAVKSAIVHSTNESDLKWYCNTHCASSGGVPFFDKDTLKCSCLLSETADTAHITLMQKEANAVDLPFELIDSVDEIRPVFKRGISESIIKSENVGQSAPHPQIHHSPTTTIHRRPQHHRTHHVTPARPRHTFRSRQAAHHVPSTVNGPQHQHHRQQLHHRPSIRQRMRHRNVVGTTQKTEETFKNGQVLESAKTATGDARNAAETNRKSQIIVQPANLQ